MELTAAAHKELGITIGATHTEFRVRPDQDPMILETAARLGGGPIYRSVLLSTGVDMVHAVLDLALGRRPGIRVAEPPAPTGFYLFFADRAGTIKAVHGVEEAAAGLRRQLVEETARLATAAGFGSGVLHCEWIVDRCGPALVECAARIPGDDIATLLSLAYDTSFVQAYLAVLLGAPVELPPYPPYGAAVTFLTAPPGTVRRVTGAELAAVSPCVRSVKVTAAVEDVVHPVCSSWDRVGYVITRAPTASEAQASALRAAQVIRVETEQAR